MTLQLLVFYLLAVITAASGIMVVSARNPVHSVLFLILAFFNSAGLFVLIGAEFLRWCWSSSTWVPWRSSSCSSS